MGVAADCPDVAKYAQLPGKKTPERVQVCTVRCAPGSQAPTTPCNGTALRAVRKPMPAPRRCPTAGQNTGVHEQRDLLLVAEVGPEDHPASATPRVRTPTLWRRSERLWAD